MLRALGARVVRTPAVGRVDSLDSHIARAYKLQSEIPGSVVLDQVRARQALCAPHCLVAFRIRPRLRILSSCMVLKEI